MHRMDRPTSTGTGGSDPLSHCWPGKPARDPLIKLRPITEGFLICRNADRKVIATKQNSILKKIVGSENNLSHLR
jgi:hypothetical protein